MPEVRILRIIAKLKWLLSLRHFARQRVNAVGTVISLILSLVFAVGGGAVFYAWCHLEGAAARDKGAMWAAWILVLIWLVSPLLQFDAQRNLDLAGLRLFPLRQGTFTWIVLLDGALSPLGLVYLPLLFAVSAALSLSLWELPFVLLSLLAAVIATLGLGQALYLWLNRLLSSRRFADASLIIGVVIFMLLQGGNIYFQSRVDLGLPGWLAGTFGVLKAIFGPVFAWAFPGLAARTISAASAGQWLTACGLYTLLAAQAIVCAALAGFTARRFYAGELESSKQAKERKPKAQNKPGSRLAWLSGALGALYHRERLYIRRDPMIKAMLLQTVVGLVTFMAMILIINMQAVAPFEELANPNQGGTLGLLGGKFRHGMLLFATVFLSFSESAVLLNKFGYEGVFITHVLLSPVDRRQLLAAKSIFFLSHFAAFNLLLILALAYMLKAPPLFTIAAFLLVIHNTAIVDLAGHAVGIYMPFPYMRKGRRMRAVMPQPGCGYLLLYMLAFNLANLAVLPGAAAIGIGAMFFGWPGLLIGSLVAGLIVYLGYYFGLPRLATLLMQREPVLLAALSKTSD